MIAESHRRGVLAVWMAALLVGFALRAIPLMAARPYIAYVDEGHFLHPVARLVRDGGWNPKTYAYPQLPIVAVTAAARAVDPVYRLVRGRSLRDRIPPKSELYDVLEPFGLLLLGRCLSVGLGLGIIVLTGVLAGRLAGPVAGAAAALLAAVTPALVLRGSVATVDSYAAFFVLVCAYLTDLSRTSARPGLASLAAGAAAGGAFASKYPAVLILVAFGVTTVLLPMGLAEKSRRLGLAALGLLLGVAAGMPAAVEDPSGVLAALRFHAANYGSVTSVPLWRQVFLRAEWDIPYERAELGLVFVALALAGFVIAFRNRETAPTFWGWAVFIAVFLLLFGKQAGQPFRNLLPLVALGCVAIAVEFDWVRRRVRNPRGVDAAAAIWILVAFLFPLSLYAWTRHDLVDPRRQAMDWLVAHVRPGDRVLVVRDLVVLDQELERLPAKPAVRWVEEVEAEIAASAPRFVVAGVFQRLDRPTIDVSALPPVRSRYGVRFQAGDRPTVPYRGWWRDNHQIVSVLERTQP